MEEGNRLGRIVEFVHASFANVFGRFSLGSLPDFRPEPRLIDINLFLGVQNNLSVDRN